MTGLANAIVEGRDLRSPNPAIMVGGVAIVIVDALVGDDPDETDPEGDE